MSDLNSERRTIKRSSSALSAVVKGRESSEDFWKEDTEIVTVSRLGASFNLDRECAVGRIVSMLTRMPAEYRCYDKDTNLYRIWGLVQHCSPVNQNTAFQIGIAFIGKYAPESYFVDPLKTYRIVGMDEFGMWNVGETQAPFLSRTHHRFPAAIEVRVAVLDADGKESAVDEEALTENVSAGGASVFSALEVESGGAVKFICDSPSFTSLSVVRNRQRREGGRITLHLQFTEEEFPVNELNVPYEEDEELLSPEEDSDSVTPPIAADAESEETGAAEAGATEDEDPDELDVSEDPVAEKISGDVEDSEEGADAEEAKDADVEAQESSGVEESDDEEPDDEEGDELEGKEDSSVDDGENEESIDEDSIEPDDEAVESDEEETEEDDEEDSTEKEDDGEAEEPTEEKEETDESEVSELQEAEDKGDKENDSDDEDNDDDLDEGDTVAKDDDADEESKSD